MCIRDRLTSLKEKLYTGRIGLRSLRMLRKMGKTNEEWSERLYWIDNEAREGQKSEKTGISGNVISQAYS